MATVTARYKTKGKTFEVRVDLDEALKVKAGSGDILRALDSPNVYYDLDKGEAVSDSDLKEHFGTTDLHEVAEQIIKKGEVQKNQEFRDAEKEARISQVINLIVRNAIDQNGRPYTEERIRRATDEIHFNFDKRAPEQQMHDLLHKLKTVLPIKVDVKKVRLIVPAMYTGQVYGLLKDYKESEEWLSNGNLSAVLNIPAGMQLDFYDKLNGITHGAVQSEELGE